MMGVLKNGVYSSGNVPVVVEESIVSTISKASCLIKARKGILTLCIVDHSEARCRPR